MKKISISIKEIIKIHFVMDLYMKSVNVCSNKFENINMFLSIDYWFYDFVKKYYFSYKDADIIVDIDKKIHNVLINNKYLKLILSAINWWNMNNPDKKLILIFK